MEERITQKAMLESSDMIFFKKEKYPLKVKCLFKNKNQTSIYPWKFHNLTQIFFLEKIIQMYLKKHFILTDY